MGFTKSTDGKARTVKNIKDVTEDLTGNITSLESSVTSLSDGTGFSFPGPYSNDSAAALAGVAIGDAYFGPGGGVVIRQT